VLGDVPYIYYPFPPGDLGSNLTSGSLGPRESDPNGISLLGVPETHKHTLRLDFYTASAALEHCSADDAAEK